VGDPWEHGYLDRSLIEGGYWESAIFTVPADVSHERVLLLGDKYRNKFGQSLEGQGLTVRRMGEPMLDSRPLETDPDRRRYRLLAWCSRRPREIHVEIPDEAVPDMERMGLRLTE
jgi:hypothetical protein